MRLRGNARPACLLLAAALVAACSDDVTCKDPNEFGVILEGPEPASSDVTRNFWSAHLDALFDIDRLTGHGVGSCCEGSWPAQTGECLAISIQRRGANGDALARVVQQVEDGVRELQRKDPTASQHDLPVSIEVDGLAAPRCARGSCGPLPYEPRPGVAPPPVPTGARVVIPETTAPGPACEHDGECVPGCGACEHWTSTGLACAGVGEPRLDGSFCGCVDSRCALFF